MNSTTSASQAGNPPERPARGLIARTAVVAGTAVARLFGYLRDMVARGILATGIRPNTVTLIGPFVLTPVIVVWYMGYQRLGGWLLVGASAFDLLDGAVARLGGKTSPFGAFLDSTMDRYSDGLILAGIYLYLLRHTSHHFVYMVFWALALGGTLLPSYVRARAETMIPQCKVGFLERAERVVTIFIGAMAGNLHIAIIIVGVFGNMAAIERILYTREELEPHTTHWGRLIWRYKRLSAPHVILCAALITLLIVGHHFIPRP